MKALREALTPAVEIARTYGARGLMRRAVHETLMRSHAYTWLDRAPVGEPPPLRLLSIDRPAAVRVLTRYPEAARLAVERAHDVLGGRYPYFNGVTLDVGWPPPWHRHPTTRLAWPPDRHWTAYARMPSSAGDIKWIWEPGRFHFAWLFPRAWAVTGDARFVDETWRGLRDWMEHHPPGRGAGWYCAQELSLRCFALMFAASAFSAGGHVPDVELRRAASFLYTAAHRIDRTLGHSLSQRNNHALSEAVGLWTLAKVFPDAPRALDWQSRAELALRECLADQFAPDGAYIQESLNYHRLAVHVLLWAKLVARSCGAALPLEVDRALRSSSALLQSLVPAVGGELPNYGHNDGALLFALSSTAYRDYRPTLQHVAGALGELAPFGAGPWDEQAAWFGFGTEPVVEPPRRPDALRITSSGYASSHRGTSMVFSRISTHERHRPGQADALHVDVWHEGRNVALDPGTFAYSAPSPWGNALVETRVHNTCSIGRRSQMRRRGRFLWTHWSRATLLAQSDRDGVSLWMASVRCAWGADHLHTRLVRHAATQIDVLDCLAGSRPAALRLHWNLEGVGWRRDGWRWEDQGSVVMIEPAPNAAVRDVRGEPDGVLGWMSPTYGQRFPCTAIEVELEASRAWFHTVFARTDVPIVHLPVAALEGWRRGEHQEAVRLLTERP